MNSYRLSLMFVLTLITTCIMASTAASAAAQQGETITAPSSGQDGTWGKAVSSAFDVASSKAESNIHIGKYIADAAKISIASNGRFTLALSGGSQPEVSQDPIRPRPEIRTHSA